MGMSIDEALETIKGERWISCQEKYIEAMNLITNTMCKYEKIEQIMNDRYGKPVFKTLDEVIKVVEDGKDNDLFCNCDIYVNF